MVTVILLQFRFAGSHPPLFLRLRTATKNGPYGPFFSLVDEAGFGVKDPLSEAEDVESCLILEQAGRAMLTVR